MAVPIRTCVGCRARAEAPSLVRVAWDESVNRLAVDSRRRLGGRGAWLHPKADCLEMAVRRKAFGRALRRRVTPADAEGLATQLPGA